MSDTANTTAPSDQPRKHARVRSRHHRASTYNQFGISRKDMILGSILLVILASALLWAVYTFCMKGGESGSADVAVPEDGHESTRF